MIDTYMMYSKTVCTAAGVSRSFLIVTAALALKDLSTRDLDEEIK